MTTTEASPTNDAQTGPGYASPEAAMKAEREKLLYTIALYVGTEVEQPDYLATVDVDPDSPTYSEVVHRTVMPNRGDELHHFGWNICSSCHGDPSKSRRFLVIPGQRSSRIYIVDTKDERTPELHKVIEPEEIKEKTNLTAPHTTHCLSDKLIISMLGDGDGNGPGGFLTLDEHFNITGRWEAKTDPMRFNYDFWYQPRHNVMVSSEWASPSTYYPGFDLDDVKAGKYGQHIHFWDWEKHEIVQSFDLGEDGLLPLELRFHHNPDSTHGFVGAALSSNMWHWHKADGEWKVEKVIDVPSVEVEGWPIPMPSLITDLLISMDDRYLYFANWLHGDIRQYDISDPSHPKLTGQVWCGGLTGKAGEVERQEADRRSPDDPAQPRRQAALCHQLAVQHLGQPVLSRHGQGRFVHAADRLRQREGRPRDQPELPGRFRQRARRAGARPRDALSRRRLHLRHLALIHAFKGALITPPPSTAGASAADPSHQGRG